MMKNWAPRLLAAALMVVVLTAAATSNVYAEEEQTTVRAGDSIYYRCFCLELADAEIVAKRGGLMTGTASCRCTQVCPLGALLVEWMSGPYKLNGKETSIWRSLDVMPRNGEFEEQFVFIFDDSGPWERAGET